MSESNKKSRASKILILVGSILLVVMAIFHGSGIFYVSDLVNKSNAEEFLKEIIPVLFAHPSIHLIGLSALGFVSLYLKQDAKKVLYLLTILVLIDTVLAFVIGGPIPGIILTVPVLCFSFATFISYPSAAGSQQGV